MKLAPNSGARIAVLGGRGGIGRALVDALSANGCRVAALDLPASLERHPVEGDVVAVPCDAHDPSSLVQAANALAQTWDGLDGLVNLCGFASAKLPIAETDIDAWDEVVSGNLRAAFAISQAAKPLLDKGHSPSVVHITSGIATLGTPGYGPYGASKAGVINLVKTLAQEWAPAIRVNAVAPSAVDTAFLRGGTGRGREEGPPERLDLDAYEQRVPLGRIATPDDIVGPILFLLGPSSGYLTGQTLHVNGGLLMP
ncbi:MAG: SDR family oxidoreductase [Pseudomonadota bacterium]